MDTTRISELASELRQLDRKIDETRRELQREIRELDSKVRMLKMDAVTKVHAAVAAFVVWNIIMLIVTTRS